MQLQQRKSWTRMNQTPLVYPSQGDIVPIPSSEETPPQVEALTG